MFVSIIIPVLNEEDYIAELLECFERQTYKNFEVIIVDGGSTDATEKVVNGFMDKLPLSFAHSPTKGVSFQRNFGASLAKSEVLMFFDADVVISSTFIDDVVGYLKDHQEIDVLSTWLRPNTDETFYRIMYGVYNRAAHRTQKWLPLAAGAFICVRKKVFDALHGFSEQLAVAEDYDLIQRAGKMKFKFALLRDPRVYFSLRRVQKLGRTRYLLSIGRSIVYFPLRSVLKNSKWVNYPMEGGTFYKEVDKGRTKRG